MCGITGFTHQNGIPPSGRIQAATRTLTHRGPDQTGVFESQFVSLGAVRLKVIDLSGGDQSWMILREGAIPTHEIALALQR